MSEIYSHFQELEVKRKLTRSFTYKQKIVSDTIDKVTHVFSEASKLYNKGLISYEDALSKYVDAFNDAYGIVPELRMSVRINETNKDQFVEDYTSWPNEVNRSSGDSLEWLWCEISDSSEKVCWIPATSQEKILLLRLFHAMNIPVEYFEPAPSNIICPFVYEQDSRQPEIVVPSIVSDDGLLTHEAPVGHHFTLVNKLGLKIIVDVQSENRNFLHHPLQPDGYWLNCIGSLEGYTTNLPRPMSFYINKGEIHRIKYLAESEDHSVFYGYPLWQDYFRYLKKHKAVFEEMIKQIFTSNIRRTYSVQ